MSQPQKPSSVSQEKKIGLPQKIPITYLWFGKSVPEDYLISLSELDYPVIFIKNAELDRKFTRQIMDVEKSDYYRLQYLYEYGGIYSDFDNVINYPCLMELLKPYRTQDKLVFMTDGKHTRAKIKEMTNNLIFAPYPKMPLLKKMLNEVDEKKGKIWKFAGMSHVAKYSQPLEVNMDKCVKHEGDWSWFAASNRVLKKKRAPTKKYANKLTKKKDIIQQNSKLHTQIQKEKVSSTKLKTDFTKLTGEYKKLKEDFEKFKKDETQKKLVFPQDEKPPSPLQLQNNQEQIKEIKNPQLNDSEWIRQKLTMQNQIYQLSSQNEDLQFERNASLFAVGGSMFLMLILILVGIKLMRRGRKSFSKVPSEKTIADESQIDSH